MGVEWFGMVMGLGFVLSFGYWCTDFLVVQRAMAAETMNAARRTPLIAAVPKMFFPFLVILPGIIALALTTHAAPGAPPLLPVLRSGAYDYNMALPLLMSRYYPAGLLGLGLTALIACFMSGMAGNVTAFNTVWTYDIYQSYIAPKASDAHYLWMGRAATVAGVALSVGTAYVAMRFDNIMDMLQLVFGFVNAPLFATFLLGMFWQRTTGDGAFWGLVSGTAAAALHYLLTTRAGRRCAHRQARRTARLPVRHGAELLGRDMGVVDLFRGHAGGQPGDPAQDRRGPRGAGLRADAAPRRHRERVVHAARPARGRRAGVDDDAQPAVLVRARMDLRLPIGLLFSILGAVLTVTGLVDGTRVLDLNVDLIWGVVVLAFGCGSLLLAHRASRR